MRGLDIRIRYAQAKIVKALDLRHPDFECYGDHLLDDVLEDAVALGHYDYEDGRNEPPALFQGEVELVDAWIYGWEMA